MPKNLKEMLHTWNKKYFRTFARKTLLKRVWMETPKYFSWKIWLARNKKIIHQEYQMARKVVAQAKGLLIESI